jgi:hypothetical protein
MFLCKPKISHTPVGLLHGKLHGVYKIQADDSDSKVLNRGNLLQVRN